MQNNTLSTGSSFIISRVWLRQLGVLFLIIGSAGFMIENIIFLRLPRLYDFGLSFLVAILSMALFFAAYGLKFRNKVTFIAWIIVIILGLIRAFVRWLTGEFIFSEWIASFGLFLFSFTVFMVTSGYTVSRKDLESILPAFLFISFGFSLFTIIQFIVGNIWQILLHLPYQWLTLVTVNYTMFQQRLLGYGVFRAFGLAAEPAYQGIALTTLLSIVIFFERIKLFTNRKTFWLILIILFLGIFVTFSLGSWLMALIMMLPFIIKHPKYILGASIVTTVLIFFLLIFLSTSDFIGPVTQRIESVLNSQDKSAQIRINGPLEILLLPPRDPIDALFGTGLGLQKMNTELVYLDEKYEGSGSLYNINNTLAKVKLTQGLFGIIAFILISFIVFKPFKPQFLLYQSLFITWFLRLFLTGSYLVPTIWCFMALIIVLRQSNRLLVQPNNQVG